MYLFSLKCCHSDVSLTHAETLIVVEVLDALMNHLEETLETVLSRGENLTLDNKVRKQSSNTNTSSSVFCCSSPMFCCASFMFSFGSPTFNCGSTMFSCGSLFLPSSRSCCQHCCWRSRRWDVLCVGGSMRSSCSGTAAWPDCCLETCCTRTSPLAFSPSSPPMSAPHHTIQQIK